MKLTILTSKPEINKENFKTINHKKLTLNIIKIEQNTQNYEQILTQKLQNPDLIITFEFYKKITQNIINNHKNKIFNIHPTLLPKYGGKGYYADKCITEPLKNKDKQTGITLHTIEDEIYDSGKIILQKTTNIEKNETFQTLSKKLEKLKLEILQEFIKNKSN